MDLITLLILIGVILLIPTAYAAYIGAPYAPTFTPAVKKSLGAIKLNASDYLVDLGAGDGKVLIEASRRGAQTLGYELSPIMWFISLMRILFANNKRGINQRVAPWKGFRPEKAKGVRNPKPKVPDILSRRILLKNFFKQTLPKEVTVVFAFLMPQNMDKVKQYLSKQYLPQGKYFLAYAFPLNNVKPLHVVDTKNCSPVYVYNLKNLTKPQK